MPKKKIPQKKRGSRMLPALPADERWFARDRRVKNNMFYDPHQEVETIPTEKISKKVFKKMENRLPTGLLNDDDDGNFEKRREVNKKNRMKEMWGENNMFYNPHQEEVGTIPPGMINGEKRLPENLLVGGYKKSRKKKKRKTRKRRKTKRKSRKRKTKRRRKSRKRR